MVPPVEDGSIVGKVLLVNDDIPPPVANGIIVDVLVKEGIPVNGIPPVGAPIPVVGIPPVGAIPVVGIPPVGAIPVVDIPPVGAPIPAVGNPPVGAIPVAIDGTELENKLRSPSKSRPVRSVCAAVAGVNCWFVGVEVISRGGCKHELNKNN